MNDYHLKTHMANARGWVLLAISAILFAVLVLCSGCFIRTVYIPHGQPVRLRQPIRSVKVWALDETGKPIPGEMDLPEGWFCGPKKDSKDD